jgi:hypothetical protein
MIDSKDLGARLKIHQVVEALELCKAAGDDDRAAIDEAVPDEMAKWLKAIAGPAPSVVIAVPWMFWLMHGRHMAIFPMHRFVDIQDAKYKARFRSAMRSRTGNRLRQLLHSFAHPHPCGVSVGHWLIRIDTKQDMNAWRMNRIVEI